jgi:hypothetical protein
MKHLLINQVNNKKRMSISHYLKKEKILSLKKVKKTIKEVKVIQ